MADEERELADVFRDRLPDWPDEKIARLCRIIIASRGLAACLVAEDKAELAREGAELLRKIGIEFD